MIILFFFYNTFSFQTMIIPAARSIKKTDFYCHWHLLLRHHNFYFLGILMHHKMYQCPSNLIRYRLQAVYHQCVKMTRKLRKITLLPPSENTSSITYIQVKNDEQVFHRNSNSTEISFYPHSSSEELIVVKFCTWNGGYAVVACANFCRGIVLYNEGARKNIFPSNLKYDGKSFVKSPPPVDGLCTDFGIISIPWWRYQMEAFSALLALCVGNLPVTGEFPS